MLKNILFAGCLFLLSWRGYSQTSLEELLQQVEQNNLELQALSTALEGKRFELLSGNNLPDPEVGIFYLPFGENITGDYTEYQITQSFEFPTVYSSRKNLINQQVSQYELEYKARRQEILGSAQAYALELILISKKLDVFTSRTEQAKTVFDQVNQLFQKEEVGILELNKAKVAWLQQQFAVQQLENQIQNLKGQLENLNGGTSITAIPEEYPVFAGLTDSDSIWTEKLKSEPQLLQIQQEELLAQQSLQLEKNKVLPNLAAGFNRQGVMGSYYSGIYGGLTIPLWGSRGKVKAAQSQVEFQAQNSLSKVNLARAQFDREYRNYTLLRAKFTEYQSTLTALDSEELLLQAYQLGELSFLQYFQEIQFFRQAFDTFLEMQHQLYQSHTSILKHQL
ncbi:TolC family protein [Algoriphagus boritolerans]|uniref:Outer membrane protein TolC n=1 Tax=Algoriphagus boritolerans DSM 17298 = JCM 18970 TaxID=1120964 RepID=A0A1H5UFC8_9BACT|nr:TolC family protein [Algoriphagus boritolerans]SEF73061.1 Outer membrane protein TolC [Algoriphagus boritolerans DSM 17298 = JCM 18970]